MFVMPDVVGGGGWGLGNGGRHKRLEDHGHLGDVVLGDWLKSGGQSTECAHMTTPRAAAAMIAY